MSVKLTANEWQSKFIDAFEHELKTNLVTLSLKEWEWKLLVEALRNAGKRIER